MMFELGEELIGGFCEAARMIEDAACLESKKQGVLSLRSQLGDCGLKRRHILD